MKKHFILGYPKWAPVKFLIRLREFLLQFPSFVRLSMMYFCDGVQMHLSLFRCLERAVYHITKTYLYNFDPNKPNFYIVKLGVYRGIHYFFLFLLKNIDCGYSLEPPRRGGSNKYPQSMFWTEIWKLSEFLSENFQFLMVKFSIYLNRRVFVTIIVVFPGYLYSHVFKIQ